jgi:hypothetical protein
MGDKREKENQEAGEEDEREQTPACIHVCS